MAFTRFGESDAGELIAGRSGEDEDDDEAGVGEGDAWEQMKSGDWSAAPRDAPSETMVKQCKNNESLL